MLLEDEGCVLWKRRFVCCVAGLCAVQDKVCMFPRRSVYCKI